MTPSILTPAIFSLFTVNTVMAISHSLPQQQPSPTETQPSEKTSILDSFIEEERRDLLQTTGYQWEDFTTDAQRNQAIQSLFYNENPILDLTPLYYDGEPF